MATDTAPSMNGLYGGQYSQPAELAASTPSTSAHAGSASQPNTASTTANPKADPQEVGWFFVEQYYTTLSKSPERIHLFYSKKSQLVTGVEAEKVVPSIGVKAIGEKIKSLGIQDCKVRVLNVDSQASYHNIVVQVIGEMSNKSEPHHKFVQTFVLAEQPGGYFVLNDIFRYLNIDEDEIIEDEEVGEETLQEEKAPHTTAPVEEAQEKAVTTEAPIVEAESKLEGDTAKDVEMDAPAVNGNETQEDPQESALDEDDALASTDAVEEPSNAVSEVEKSAEPESTAAHTPPKTVTPAPAEAAPVKMTWANRVGAKAPAIPVLPVAAPTVPSQPKIQRSAPPVQVAKPQTPPAEADTSNEASAQGNGWQTADHSKKQNRPQSKAPEQNALAYIKNVNEKVDARILREVLERFGELKYFDVSRPKNCAFVEFADTTGYAAAVAANPHDIGGEQIYVEERRPKAAFGASNNGFGRGSGTAGRGRGALQTRTNSQGSNNFQRDATRGSFQPRGPRTGPAARGRGQSQAA